MTTKAQRKELEQQLVNSIYQGYKENEEDWRRDHLGASILGHRCDRYLWLTFRWASKPDHGGQLLKLFARGQREEHIVIRDLRTAGLIVTPVNCDTGEQFRIPEGHLGGSADGLVEGVPGNPDVHVLEIKTSNKKSFERLKSKRVRSAQPKHFVQMQIYMDGFGLKDALYVAVCKDNDEVYVELVALDQKIADKHKARAADIISAQEPPAKLDAEFPPCVLTSKDGTRWPCDFYELCHGKAMPERSCRTCTESTPCTNEVGDRTWVCGLLETRLDSEGQRKGCDLQLSIPAIVNANVAALTTEDRQITYQFADGEMVTEGKER